MLNLLDALFETLFGGIISLWLSITDISRTSIGIKAEDAIWNIVGIVGIIAVLLVAGAVISTPANWTSDDVKKNYNKPYHKKECCSNCLNYDRCKETKNISDPDRQKCSMFTR